MSEDDQQLHLTETAGVLSDIFGWTYTIFWGASFYGQMWEVYVLKSVEGLALDYVIFNLSGYVFYSIYSTYGFFAVNNEYGIGEVSVQDLVFCYHGLACMIFTAGQCVYYPKGVNKINLYAKILVVILFAYTTTYIFLTNVFNLFTPPLSLNSLHFLGYNKLVITLVKYNPQVYWNYKRKSTLGWNICNVLCDFCGGFFSFGQNAVQIVGQVGPNILPFGQVVNPVKFILGILTIIYDSIFIVQHYCLYKEKRDREFRQSIMEQRKSSERGSFGQIKIGIKQFGESVQCQNNNDMSKPILEQEVTGFQTSSNQQYQSFNNEENSNKFE